jgi:N-acetyltransferase 10
VPGRFNERLVLSLASNRNCILMDDELNILPTSASVKFIKPVPLNADGSPAHADAGVTSRAELKDLVGVCSQP